jgi:hypothetical protein
MKNGILFIIRAYNDIDHITPIVYKMNLEHPDIPVNVLIYNVINDYSSDYRVKFLKNMDIPITHIFDHLSPQVIPVNLYFRIIQYIDKMKRFNLIRLFLNRLFVLPMKRSFNSKIDHILPGELLNSIFNHKPTVIVFDQAENSFYRKLCDYAKLKSITTVAVPHGHNTLANDMIWTDSMEILPNTSTIQTPNIYNYVVYENDIIANRYIRSGLVEKDQVKVIGSSRFSDEWIEKMEGIIPAKRLPIYPKETLKVVLMLTKYKYNGHPDEIERTIEYLSNFPNLQLIVKPHTRGMRFNNTFESNVTIVDNEFHSPLLIEWADIVLFTMTSVIFDCLKKDKPILYLKNTHSNKLLSENYFHSWEVHCRDDLRAFILNAFENRNSRTYSVEDRDKYCKVMIEPHGKNVLQMYCSFIESIA